MNEEIDLSLAIQLQAQFEEELRVRLIKESEEAIKTFNAKGFHWSPKNKELPEPTQEKLSVSLIDSSWELLDPNPDIHSLFLTFNDQFFWGRLSGIEVKWSPRMTVCAGICSYQGRSGLCSVRLSIPLLKLRPRKDLIETLLHEMIHAYLFVTHNNRDHDGHGPNFHKHMYRINNLAGTKISVYHSFHDEVAVYKQHVWLCNGPCRKRPPYYGLVKRSMNRTPGPNDLWWSNHQRTCGGSYSKIKEPEGFGQKRRKAPEAKAPNSESDIRKFFPPKKKSSSDYNPGINGTTKPFFNKKSNSNPKSKINPKTTTSQPNIKTSNSSSNVNVNSIGIQNAPHSNVHGFGGANLSGTNKGFGATATRSAGSKTIVVKGKKNGNKDSTSKQVSSEDVNAFTGNGFMLGGGHSQSRLLSLGGSSSSSKAQTSHVNNLDKPNHLANPSSNFHRAETKCPLCSKIISDTDFDNHIALCIGDLDDWPHNEDDTVNLADCDNSTSNSVNVIDDNDEMDGERVDQVDFESGSQDCLEIEVNSFETKKGDSFSCPICNRSFSASEINKHANTHFT